MSEKWLSLVSEKQREVLESGGDDNVKKAAVKKEPIRELLDLNIKEFTNSIDW